MPSKYYDIGESDGDSDSRERTVIIVALLVVAVMTIFDLYEDRLEGAHWPHLITEGIVVLASVLGAAYLARKSLSHFRAREQALSADVVSAREDVKIWRAKTATILQGLGNAIDEQFKAWNLTGAEKEVGILLLKGLSHKEIANIRSTSEKTVRQQAASLYSKAGLEGRAHLSAFFLEDLLVPSDDNMNG